MTSEDMFWCVAHISKIHVKFFIYVYLCQVHCSYAILGHDCCWKMDPKIDDLCVRRRAKWFSAHVLYQVPFSCLSSTWEMYSMHPGYCSQIYVTSQKPLLAAICDCFYQAEWVIYCMHFGRMSSCNNVFWGRDLSQHVYDLWAVKHQTLSARAPLQHTMPSVCEKEPATIKTLPLSLVIWTLVTMSL